MLFPVIRNPELPPESELENMSWGVVSRSNYIVMLYVFPGRDVPEWVNFQDKFEKRVHVVNTTTLRIDNLTLEDSGLYRARQSYTRGRQYDRNFHLTVYEAVPRPQIRATDLSLTPGWCNITMECNTTETREDLTVSWESKGLPRELTQRPAPGPAPNPWTLAVNLPLSRPSPSLTCVVNNQADQKAASQDLGDVCGRGECTCQRGGTLPQLRVKVRGFCPPCLCHPLLLVLSMTLAGTSNLRLLFSVVPSPQPCWSRQHAAGTSPRPHPPFLVCLETFSGKVSWGRPGSVAPTC